MQDEHQSPFDTTGIDRGNPDAVRELLRSAHAVDAAALLDEMGPAEACALLLEEALPDRAAIFGYLRPETQVALAALMTRRQLAAIMTEMSADDRADVFNRLAPEQQGTLLPGLAQAEREDIRRLASQPEGTAGAIMTSDYATLAPKLTAREAIEVLRREAPDKETIYRAYVLDGERRLMGSVRLRDLILAPGNSRVDSLMDRDPIAVKVEDSQEGVAHKIARYDALALPVVDNGGRLVGIVTHDDAMDALQEEVTEDFQKLGGTAGKLTQSVGHATIGLLYRKRVLWLALLVFGNLFSGAVIAHYEETIAMHVALVFFLPLLIGSSGNAGAQSATLMIRALATGEVVLKDWARLLSREFFVALCLGATMAVMVSMIGFVRGGAEIASLVALTMLLVVVVGSLIGMGLPFLLNSVGLDPATASAPLVTTLADVVGVAIYFSIATTLLLTPAA